MSKRKKADQTGPGEHELVPVVYARNLDDAEHFRTILVEHDIAAVVDEDFIEEDLEPEERPKGVPVLVPVEALADAEDILAERDTVSQEIREHFDEDFEDDYDDEDDLDGFEPDGGDDIDDLYDDDDEDFEEDEEDMY